MNTMIVHTLIHYTIFHCFFWDRCHSKSLQSNSLESSTLIKLFPSRYIDQNSVSTLHCHYYSCMWPITTLCPSLHPYYSELILIIDTHICIRTCMFGYILSLCVVSGIKFRKAFLSKWAKEAISVEEKFILFL